MPAIGTLLFDGHCNFCRAASARLSRMAGPALLLLSYRDEGVLARFPAVTEQMCDQAMQLIRPDGTVHSGAEAAVIALSARWYGPLLRIYFAPGLRQLADFAYRKVAENRFRIAGRACDGGSCAVRLQKT